MLWRVSSVSSAPLLDLDLGDAAEAGDGEPSSAGASSGGAKAPDAADVFVIGGGELYKAAIGDARIFASGRDVPRDTRGTAQPRGGASRAAAADRPRAQLVSRLLVRRPAEARREARCLLARILRITVPA